jgi:16S rRNA C967 or C1407 C5-methylase (RsmB/RsmF family)
MKAELTDFLQKANEQMATEEESEEGAQPTTRHHAARHHPLEFLEGAYQMGLDRKTIRTCEHLEQFHDWLKQQTLTGNITRQETVSMIPPVVLDVQPTDAVLDMCAAPGSKTSQMLECLGPAGVLVANDASSQRAYMLVHQLRRIMDSHPVVLVTTCQAQFFPSGVAQFDRILCDVPCTGDGTTRKNIGVWRTWTQASALALHALQAQIAWKGVSDLLRVGGTMCYSTCSLNPVENEAVVAEILRRADGALELVDCSGQLAGFRVRPGMTTWKVLCEDKTRREMKNKRNKMSPKMQAKRKEWAEKEAVAAKREKGEDDGDRKPAAVVGEGNGDCSKPAVVVEEAAAVNKEKKETCPADKVDSSPEPPSDAAAGETDAYSTDGAVTGDEYRADQEKTFGRTFQPASMDDATLMEMAQSAGLAHYEIVEDVPWKLEKRVRASCFPPGQDFHLERCVRCLPQDNDTGGFFIALIRKVRPIGKADRRSAAAAAANDAAETPVDGESEPESKKPRVEKPEEVDKSTEATEPEEEEDVDMEDLAGLDTDNKPIRGKVKGNFIPGSDVGRDDFVTVKDEVMDPLVEYFGLSNGFERDLYMARAGSAGKIIYYIARSVKNLMDQGIQERVTGTSLLGKKFYQAKVSPD